MANWKNVNNWHWTEKNCLNWAKEYFEAKLTNLSFEKDGFTTTVTSVTSVTGDVDLNQRKGKIITLYDMALKLCWKGTSADGVEAEGRITIPEIAHDTESSDYVFEITVDSDTRSKDPIRQVVRTHLTAEIKQVFASFAKDLIDSHSKDVYIDPSRLGTPAQNSANPAVSQPEPPKKAGGTTSTFKSSNVPNAPINTCTLKDTIEFVASGMDIFQALTDPTLVSIWTRSPATISKEIDSSFSLFGGNIQGTVKELVPGKKIVQKWRTNNWPEGHYSTVTILLEEQTGSVNLILEQSGVPVGELDITRRNWAQFYWNSLKSTFGYGATL